MEQNNHLAESTEIENKKIESTEDLDAKNRFINGLENLGHNIQEEAGENQERLTGIDDIDINAEELYEGIEEDIKEYLDIFLKSTQGGLYPSDIKSVKLAFVEKNGDTLMEFRIETKGVDKEMAKITSGEYKEGEYCLGAGYINKSYHSEFSDEKMVESSAKLAFTDLLQGLTSKGLSVLQGESGQRRLKEAKELMAGVSNYPEKFDVSNFNGTQEDFDIFLSQFARLSKKYDISGEEVKSVKIERDELFGQNYFEKLKSFDNNPHQEYNQGMTLTITLNNGKEVKRRTNGTAESIAFNDENGATEELINDSFKDLKELV